MTFVQINNNIYLDDITIKKIGAEGFAIYCLLLIKQGGNEFVDFSVNSILAYTNRTDSTKLKYSDKERNIPRLNNLKTIRPYLKALEREGLLSLVTKCDLLKVRANDTIICTVKSKVEDKTGFIQVSHKLFVNAIDKIGHTGWLIYCLLYRHHNSTYGSETSDGFANPSLDFMERKLNISKKTISIYLKLLEECKLIKIEEVKPVYVGDTALGTPIFDNYPNNYIVNARCRNNKYFISQTQ